MAIRKRMYPGFIKISRLLTGLIVMALVNLGCRPVITIGWQEIVIVVVLLLVLVGPSLFRLVQRVEEFRTWRNQIDKDLPED